MKLFLIWNYEILAVKKFFLGNLSKEDLSKYIKMSDTFTLEILQIWTDIKI